MEALDSYIPQPKREMDKPFLMPVEDVFSITGRGTVATGRIERGVVKVGDEVAMVGFGSDKKTVVTGVEMFRKLLDEGQAGDNVGLLLRGIGKDEVERGMVLAKAGTHHAAHAVLGGSVRVDEGRGGAAHAVFQGVSAAVLLSDDGRDGERAVAGGDGDGDAGGQHPDEIELITPIAMDEGLRFAIREGGRTVGRRRRHQDHQVNGGARHAARPPETRSSAPLVSGACQSASWIHMAGRIRIRLKAFDHAVIDQAVG